MTNNYQVLLSMIFTLSQLLLIAIDCNDEMAKELALTVHQLDEIKSKYYYNPNNYDPNDDEY